MKNNNSLISDSEVDKLKKDFEANLLDGDKIQAGQMIASTEIFLYIEDLVKREKQAVKAEVLSKAEKTHLLSLFKDNEREGSYYGNREQYWKRSERIKRKLRWWFAEQAYNERHKTFSVRNGESCDFCSAEMKYAGANFKNHIVRACGFHLNKAKSILRKEREEYGLELLK